MSGAGQFGPKGWTPDRLPDLAGKTYLITGGNSGIGWEAARMLGARGATVVIFCRSEDKAADAVARLNAAAPAGDFSSIGMDLSDLSWVRLAVKRARDRFDKIDGLVNNAGIMMVPTRQTTVDGFETQLGVNHLGHFAFAGLLSDLVEAAGGRFVSVASIAHRYAPRLRFDDLMFERRYTPVGAYAQSKLANLIYGRELDRRLNARGCKAQSYVCHPGWSATNLQTTGPSPLMAALFRPANALFSQPAAAGAVPTVLCAAAPEAEAGGYYGPTGFREFKGPVGRASMARQARDENAAARLWEISEELTGVNWPILSGS